MASPLDELPDRLTMTEILRLQDALSKALVRRFEKRLALVFSDIVGSTPYFARFGDAEGQKLQQRHADFVHAAAHAGEGRVVDMAGDGAFLCFASADRALLATMQLEDTIARDNDHRSADERWGVRIGVHYGSVLTDGDRVSGDAVNYCARVAASAEQSEIRITREAFGALTDAQLRLKCRRLGAVALKGLERPTELLAVDWLDRDRFPVAFRLGDGPDQLLPHREVIRFGRLRDQDGMIANDVVLATSDSQETNRISRWHFELHRRGEGFVLRTVTDAPTELDGRTLAKGEEAAVRPGSRIRVGGVLTIELLGDPRLRMAEKTVLPR
jgi:adenylate cyclase